MKIFQISFLLAIASSMCAAQWSQQGSKLFGSGAVGWANQGASVFISSDGNTGIVGGWSDNSSAGAAWVYTRACGVWGQQGDKLVGTGAVGSAHQGSSVSLSADGNTAIVGGHNDNGGVGAAWVFTRTGGVWTQQGNKLVGSGAVGSANQGWSVSLSSDGNTAIVGGYRDNGGIGAVWVYARTGGVWSQQGSKLVGSGAVGNAWQGASVSLSSDGNTAIVGGEIDNSWQGAAWVYTRIGNVWTQQGNKLVGLDAVWYSHQGYSVSLSSDGNSAIIGGLYDNHDVGAAWVFTRTGGVWSQQGGKLVGSDAIGTAHQGHSVSLSSDGNTAIVGGPLDNGFTGAAWIFTRTGGTWCQQGNKLVGIGASSTAHQGSSVSLSSEGTTAIVGGVYDELNVGAAWVFIKAPPPSPVIATDNFNAHQLDLSVWAKKTVWDATFCMTGTQTSFAVPAGASHDIYSYENKAPRIIQPITNITSFDVEAKFDAAMTAAYQLEGIVVEQDAANLLRFGFHSDGGNIYVEAISLTDNLPTSWLSQSISGVGVAPLYMRVHRTNDTWTLDYSTNGTNWSTAGSFSFALTATGIGPFIGNAGGSPPSFTGLIDYFMNLNSLPVQLANFTAHVQNGHQVRLDWTTLSEINNYGFYVQRRLQSVQQWADLPNSFVPGHGTTNQPHDYSFADNPASSGDLQYRLKQVDLDGTIHYSEPINVSSLTSVKDVVPIEFALEQCYPNPFNPSTTIKFQIPNPNHVSLKVYDVVGREVATLVNEARTAGVYDEVFDATNLSSGMYFYKLESGNFVQTKKMLLLR